MSPNPQFFADFATFTEQILNGKLHFLCIVHTEKFIWLKSNEIGQYLIHSQGILDISILYLLRFCKQKLLKFGIRLMIIWFLTL